MLVKGEVAYKYAIILDVNSMRLIDDTIKKQCDRVRYTAELKNGREEVYDNLEDLLSSENFGDERIINLDVWGWQDYGINTTHIYIGSQNSVFSKSMSVRYSYELSDKQLANEFEADFNHILSKSKASYWIASKIDSTYILIFISVVLLFISQIPKYKKQTINVSSTQFALVVVLVALALIAIKMLGKVIKRTILPIASFIWGEELKRAERMNKLRNQLFWGVLVAILVSVVGGLIGGFLL